MSMWRALEWAREHPEESPVPPIEAGLAPGGVIFRVFVDGEVAQESRVVDAARAPEAGELGGEATLRAIEAGKKVELRVYDGDTGGWVLTRQVVVL